MYRKNLKNEYYTRKAREDNYPARSVYKLQQIDGKFNLIKVGDKVLDLGCAPGSWLLYIAEKISPNGKVIGVDTVNIKIKLPDNAEFIKSDVINFSTNQEFDVIVSDLASNTSGEHFVDTEKSLEFCERALEIVQNNSKSGGNFLCKILEGEGINDFFKKVETNFAFTKRYKPMASRKESREIYIVAKNFKN